MRWQFTNGFVAALSLPWLSSCMVVSGEGGDDVGETTAIGDGDGDPGDGDGDGEDDNGDPCLPEDPAVDFSYVPFEFGVEPGEIDIDWTCTATEVDVSDGLYLLLDCPDASMPIMLDISATPSFVAPVLPGDTVHVRYVYEGPFWFNVYLRLDVDGHGHLLTMFDADSPLPPDNFAFEPPFPMLIVSGICDRIPDVCGNRERIGLAFGTDGQLAEILDSNYAIIGGDPGTEVWVATAEHLHDINCTDTPDEWYRVLIVNTGSG